jgi:hypothetical protein
MKEMITIQQDTQKDIEEIIDGLKCPKDFSCYISKFKSLCRAKDIGLESFIACMDKDPLGCKFSILFGGLFFCQCTLRVYVAKNLQK